MQGGREGPECGETLEPEREGVVLKVKNFIDTSILNDQGSNSKLRVNNNEEFLFDGRVFSDSFEPSKILGLSLGFLSCLTPP